MTLPQPLRQEAKKVTDPQGSSPRLRGVCTHGVPPQTNAVPKDDELYGVSLIRRFNFYLGAFSQNQTS